ncbi:hypothetical protein [Tistrella mobilis]|jgi:hypothetical protein|uniref:ABC transporter permease n=1 Tax=Tistrella mobilis (strain KA081020-065) TaxID=1110502 RepID=I3TK30_TISMK|nr:hypothetical protein [Tistrella mobilis]AFK53118.1 hypothetical protein TMO_1279 [Tistrella mobilis KA081020-065]
MDLHRPVATPPVPHPPPGQALMRSALGVGVLRRLLIAAIPVALLWLAVMGAIR